MPPLGDRDHALAAAFALRDREGLPSRAVDQLRELLPPSMEDVPEPERPGLAAAALAIIERDPEASDWFRAALAHVRSFGPVSSLPPPETYECPKGDFRFTRPSATYPIPLCPVHHIALVRV